MVLVTGDGGWDQRGGNRDREKWAKRGQNPRREYGQVPRRVQSWDDHASIGHRRDSDLLKPLPALRLSKRQRKDSKRDIGHVNKAPWGSQTWFPLVYMQQALFF